MTTAKRLRRLKRQRATIEVMQMQVGQAAAPTARQAAMAARRRQAQLDLIRKARS